MGRISATATIGGKNITGSSDLAAATETSTQVLVPAGKAGTLSTRTDDDTGILTLATGHGITTGAIIDLYWAGGIRRGVTVGTVAGDSVPFGAAGGEGVGDVLPVVATAVVACVRQLVDLDVLGSTVKMAAASVSTGCRGSIEFQQEAGTAIKSLDLTASATEPAIWTQTPQDTNPFAGVSIGRVAVSNGVSTGACTILFGLVRENVT